MPKRTWLPLNPDVSPSGHAVLTNLSRQLARVDILEDDAGHKIHRLREKALVKSLECGTSAQAVRVCTSVLCDLKGQGWRVDGRRNELRIALPSGHDVPLAEKARVRAGLLVERDRQLRQPSVRRFIHDMERRRIGPQGEWVSIFSLMRDGEELAETLKTAASVYAPDERHHILKQVVRPYLQLADDSKCELTGFRLKEIWRYFRYTWSSPHKNLPGRAVWYLVRDEAADHHPVVGIAALGSAVVQLAIRDEWIGWTPANFLDRLRAEPSDQWATWIHNRLQDQLDGLWLGDLVKDIGPRGLADPSPELIAKLRTLGSEARKEHRRFGSTRDHKSANGASINWEERARTPLFISKRATTLADILSDQMALRQAGFARPTGAHLERALRDRPARRAIVRILRRVKATHVGIDMLDITACGAVAPYNHILGGKLVSMLLTSPEVRIAYQERYANRASVIASAMAGRPVCRKPRLVLLGTTSLYGVGSSQYNRLRVPAENAGGSGHATLRFENLGSTRGYGSFHFSSDTLTEIRAFYAQTGNGRAVKHIFGEGANPRMREVREALQRIGLPSDRMLRHENTRVVYAVPLARNFRDVLIEKENDADFITPDLSSSAEGTEAIADYWRQRWLSRRIGQDRILTDVSRHTLAYPIDHGARVHAPTAYEEEPLLVYNPDH